MTDALLLSLGLVCGVLLLRGKREVPEGDSPAWLEGRWAPIAAGLVTAVAVAWIWGGLRAIPVWHDEAAYLLQARIFATGHWTAPGRPLPEFFEQTHVFVTPVLASKYPPGHSLLLVPGIWLALPGLVPVVANGVAAFFLFLLARRLGGPRVALVCWLIWLTAPGDLATRASYFSQTTSSALWLAGWWSLLRWRETGRPGYLVALAAVAGWEFLTRPLTMVAFSIPVGVVVIRDVARRRAWRPLLLATLLGGMLLAVFPLWSWETLGTWRTTPYRRYSTVYYPYQWAGFTFNDAAPLRPHPPEMDAFDRMFRQVQREHRVADLPAIFTRRVSAISRDMWGGGRRLLLAFAVVGAMVSGSAVWFGLAGALILVLAHLVYPHPSSWTVYYIEMHAVLAYVTARGLMSVVHRMLAFARRLAASPALISRVSLAVCLPLVILPAIPDVLFARRSVSERGAIQQSFREAVAALPDAKTVVFVRHSPGHDPHRELVTNEVDLEGARAWIVYDRGPRNAELLRVAPERAAYLYDESRRRLTRLEKAGG